MPSPAVAVPALALPVDAKAGVSFRGYASTAPRRLTITTGGPALLVTLTLPEQLEVGHVEFARELAAKAWAYAVGSRAPSTGACSRCPASRPPHVLAARPDTWTRGPGQPGTARLATKQEVTA